MSKSSFPNRILRGVGPRWFVPNWSGQKSALYLTFDDGPGPYTARLSTMLASRGMTATFFLLATNLNGYETVVEQLESDGHTVALHGFSHISAWMNRPQHVVDDIKKGFECLSSLVKYPVCWYRPPFGRVTPWGIKAAGTLGMATILWDKNPRDYSRFSSAEEVQSSVSTWATAGSVVLLHENGKIWSNFDVQMNTLLDSLQHRSLQLKGLPR